MCLLIILLILQLLLGSTESGICEVNQGTIVSIPSCQKDMDTTNGCFNNVGIKTTTHGIKRIILEVKAENQVFNIDETKNVILIFFNGEHVNSESLNPQPDYFNMLCRVQSTSPSTNCESSDPEEKGDATFFTTVAILSFLVCVLGFTVAVLAVALYRTRRTKRTARLPLPPPPGPPVLQVANHDYSTVYEELPNMDGVKTQGEQNRLTENHERYTLSGLINTDRVPNRTKMREAVTIKEVQERGDTATSSSEEHVYSVLEKEIEEDRSDSKYSIDKEGTYHVLEECLPEKDQDQKEVEDHYHVLDPEAVSTGEDSTNTEEQAC